MQLIAYACSLYFILKCAHTKVFYLKNLNFNANGAPNLGQSKHQYQTDKSVLEDIHKDDIFKDGDINIEAYKDEQREHRRTGNDFIITPEQLKLQHEAAASEEAKYTKIFVINRDEFNEIQLAEDKLNKLNFYNALSNNETHAPEYEMDEIRGGSILLGILSSLRRNDADAEKRKEDNFNAYVPISDDIVNPAFLPRDSMEKIVYKNGLPLIDLKGDGVRIMN